MNPNQVIQSVCEKLDVNYNEPVLKKTKRNKTTPKTRAQLIAYKYKFIRKLALILPERVRKVVNNMPIKGKQCKAGLNESQRSQIYDLIEKDMRCFKQEYGFPIEK